jgi:hypothetical protein
MSRPLTQADFAGFQAVMEHLLRVRRGLHASHPRMGYGQDVHALERAAAMAAQAEDTLRTHMERAA